MNKHVYLIAVGIFLSHNIWGMGGEIARLAAEDIGKELAEGMTKGAEREGAEVLAKETIESASKELADNFGRTLEQGLKDAGIDLSKISEGDLSKALQGVGKDLSDVFSGKNFSAVTPEELSNALKTSFDKNFGDLGVSVEKVSFAKVDLQAFSKLQEGLSGEVTIRVKEPTVDPEKQRLIKAYDDAKAEYSKAKQDYDAIKDKEDVLPAEREAKLNKYVEAEKNFDKASKDIAQSDKFTRAEKSWRAVQRNLWTKRNYAGSFRSGGKFLGESLKQGLVMGLFFMVPGWGQQALDSYGQSQAQLDSIGEPQYIGNVWMQIPDALLNTDDPLNTVPLYIGIPTATRDSVAALKKGVRARLALDAATAHYFVTSGDYGFGKYSLPTSATAQMTHLNTGYDFYGDGSPINKIIPMEQLLGQASAQSRSKTLVQNIAEVAGRVQQGGVAKEFGVEFYKGLYQEVRQKPSPEIAAVLQSATLDDAPLVLSKTIEQIQAEHKLGDLLLTAIKGLKGDTQAATVLNAQATNLAPALPYPAYNLFIYQTPSTQLAKAARASASAQSAPYIYDYVIALDKLGRYVPAVIPLTSTSADQMSVFPSYGPNPAVASVISLLDNTITGIDGSSQGTGDWTKIIKSDQIEAFNQLQPQIVLMKQFITTQAAQGPFAIGSYILSIPKELSNLYANGIWIYEIHPAEGLLEGSTAGNYADYVVALDNKFALAQLPSGSVSYFFSLVSSRVYTKDLVPATENVSFSVVQYGNSAYMVPTSELSSWQQQAATDKQTFAEIFKGITPRSTLYMDYDINPYNRAVSKTIPADVKAAGGALGLAQQGLIPMRPQYVWTQLPMFVGDDQKRLSARAYLQDKASVLVSNVQGSYTQWRKAMAPLIDSLNLVGPFNFTSKLLNNIRIQATSLEDVRHGNYVYTSPYIPQQYLVLALQPSATDSSCGAAFNVLQSQPYLLSLTTGAAYKRDSSDAVVQVKNDAGLPIILDPQQLLATVQRNQGASFLQPLLNVVTTSQQKYLTQRPMKQFFYRFGLYLDPQDERSGSYIYQDVTTLDPKDYGNVQKSTDFFVCAQLDNDGNATNLGTPLTGDTQIIISLLNGITYDRKGFVGPIGKKDQVGFVSAFDSLAGSLPGTIRPALRAEIKRRVDLLAKAYQGELLAMQQAQEKELPRLDGNILAQLKSNDFLASPYDTLKAVGDRYYGVTSIPVGTTIIEGSFDYATGVMYDGDGKALISYKGLLLDDMRRAVGLSIDTNNKEKLGIPNSSLRLPLTTKDGKNAFVSVAAVQPGIDAQITLGTTRYELFFNTVANAYIAKVTFADGSSYYLDLYGGYRFNLDGSARHMQAQVATAQGASLPLFVGENPDGTRWFFVPQENAYKQYQFNSAVSTPQGEALLAQNTYLDSSVLIYQRMIDNRMTYSVMKQAGVDDSGNARFAFDKLYSQTGQAEVLNYLRSATPTTGTNDYGSIPTTYDIAQDVPLLVIRLASGAASKVLAHVPAFSFDALLFDTTSPRAGKSGDTMYTLQKTFDDTSYTFEFHDRRVDTATGGMYASLSSTTNIMYFVYDDRPLMADKLQQLQDQLKLYVVTDVTGVPQLVKSLSANLKTVTRIDQVPDASKVLMDRVMQTGSFKYDPLTNRYLYQLVPSDQGKTYYRDGVAYVDLLSGIVYFDDGKPVTIPLLPSQLVQLHNEKHVGVPVDSKGNAIVGSGGQPYLVYK